MNHSRAMCWSAAVIAVAPGAAVAQAPASDPKALIALVRDATAKYRDRAVAIADGYRMVGPDFPGMGEHWISVRLLMNGKIDLAQPPILEYANIGGIPTLLGVAYAALVRDSIGIPGGFPVAREAWHFHAGTVDEESFLLDHTNIMAASAPGPRVAVLHVWAWLDNPAGAFATDNWALPYARLGLTHPADIGGEDGGRAVALAAGGAEYFAAVVAAASPLDSVRRARTLEELVRGAERIRAILGTAPGPAAVRAAAAEWRSLWQSVQPRSTEMK